MLFDLTRGRVARKYRDERRPRLGLMRGREFTMKDLYTFDATEDAALITYQEVQSAYKALFEEIGLPYIHVRSVPLSFSEHFLTNEKGRGRLRKHGGFAIPRVPFPLCHGRGYCYLVPELRLLCQ